MPNIKGRRAGGDGSRKAAQQSRMREYAEGALDMLFQLASGAESEAVRVSAIKELLDRGFGKSPASAGADSPPAITRIERVIIHPKS